MEQAMTHSSRRRLIALTLGMLGGLAVGGDEPARQDPPAPDAEDSDHAFGHERFCVTIWPAKTQVNVGEEFEVKLRVVNSSQEPQSIKVASCSWDQHWTWSNRRISYKMWPCYRNAIVNLQLQPGEAYEQKLAMNIEGKGPSKTESLRMGFKPPGETKTYWSNEVVLSVK
jgi:hypothetical protein